MSLGISAREKRWYKGNTRCHTLNSGGDEYSRKLIRWYRDHGYNFIAITEHNFITEVQYLDTDSKDDFLLIQSAEESDYLQGTPIQRNALHTKTLREPQKGDELYIRARVFESSDKFACTQPVFLKKLQ
jgi:predicted metal-dependent phosphoesterase TrpH